MIYSIDRFEGDFAVCEDEKRNIIQFPREIFPDEAKETYCFSFDENNNIKIDYLETEKRKERIFRLQQKLFGISDSD